MKFIFRSIFQVIFLTFFVLNVVLTVDGSTAAKNLHDVRTFSPLDTYYDMLEVDINAGPNSIKRSYRKIALAHHPDKIKHDGRTPEEIENQQSYFVKVTRAHEILSDKKTRTRYDYLLSKGVLEYDDKYQDWDEFHRQRGGDYTMMVTKKHDGTAKYWFKDAFALKEDQSADFALIFSGSLLFLCITIPLYLHFKAKKEEKERQETEEAEKQRRKIAHINKIRADMARKSNKAGGNKSAPSDSVKDNLFAGIGVDDLEETAEEDMAEQPTTMKGSNALTFQCSTCTKSYKTANQLKQHFESREHKKAEKLRVQTEKANKK